MLNLYCAKGIRVGGRRSGSTAVVIRSDYDGQMPVFERQFLGGIQQWKRYNALGARGIDGWYNSASSSWHYPIYDVHGNVKATLTRSGGTGHAIANWKSFDVWGGERASEGSASMFGYCGNLGHPTDPESGLIYMRARFYEPWTGRFLSEDSAYDGQNWYTYAGNAPSSKIDPSGNSFMDAFRMSGYGVLGIGLFCIFAAVVNVANHNSAFMLLHATQTAMLGVVLMGIGAGMTGRIDTVEGTVLALGGLGIECLVKLAAPFYKELIAKQLSAFAASDRLPAGKVVMAATAYSLILLGFMFAIDIEAYL